MWLNACSSGLSVASRILSVATLSTFIGLPVSIPLGTVSLAGVSTNSMARALKKYQKKLAKVIRFADIMISALTVFEMSISKVINNGRIDEWEFTMLQTLHFGVLSNLSNVYNKMEAKTRTQLQKVYWTRSMI